jgi:NAD-dependent DNA ligase
MKIEIPTNCPCCDYPLELVNEQLFCRNAACSAQLFKKIEHFCKTLSIKGMGPKTIEKLDLQDLTELFYLDLEIVTEALGSRKTAEKLIAEIDNSKSADLATVLASFSIPLIGNTASTKIAQVVRHIDEISAETCKQAGLGEKATDNLIGWIETEYQELKEFLPFSFRSNKEDAGNANKATICITGKLVSYKSKSEAYKDLEAAGFKVVESVTKTLDYLVDEQNDSSTKRKKADQYGIEIISNLIQFLKEVQ